MSYISITKYYRWGTFKERKVIMILETRKFRVEILAFGKTLSASPSNEAGTCTHQSKGRMLYSPFYQEFIPTIPDTKSDPLQHCSIIETDAVTS